MDHRKMNRREACAAVAAFSMLGGVFAEGQAVTGADNPAGDMTQSRVCHFEQMKETPSSNGGFSRAAVRGELPTGEYVECHETTLPPGKMPHPPHRHSHSEFILVREGELEYLMDGRTEKLGPADVIFTASNRPHGLRNVGTTPARYFVVSVGVQDKATLVDLKPAQATS